LIVVLLSQLILLFIKENEMFWKKLQSTMIDQSQRETVDFIVQLIENSTLDDWDTSEYTLTHKKTKLQICNQDSPNPGFIRGPIPALFCKSERKRIADATHHILKNHLRKYLQEGKSS
jgi:hypothetical protein